MPGARLLGYVGAVAIAVGVGLAIGTANAQPAAAAPASASDSAWRYNVDTQMFEIGPYYNLDTARIMPTHDEIISVPVGEKFTFNADYQGITLQYGDTVVYKPIPAGLHPHQLSAFRINSWFGGTSLPPKTISYYMRLKPWWKTL